uniref:Ig-like domain-containing protein n=1 Tax=Pygocentrus nattereri TaxID=42514 RepID=A0A3B4C4K6_PYGNA
MVVCENPSRSAVSEILRPARLAPTTTPRSKPLKSPFFPVLMLGLHFSKSSLYSKDDVQLGSKNTLVCYITGFYPPHVGVSWTRNNSNVMDRASLSRYYLNDDETYNLVSTLSFTPEQGDIYTCTVGHTALDRPLTKTWGEIYTCYVPISV